MWTCQDLGGKLEVKRMERMVRNTHRHKGAHSAYPLLKGMSPFFQFPIAINVWEPLNDTLKHKATTTTTSICNLQCMWFSKDTCNSIISLVLCQCVSLVDHECLNRGRRLALLLRMCIRLQGGSTHSRWCHKLPRSFVQLVKQVQLLKLDIWLLCVGSWEIFFLGQPNML